MAYLSSNKFTGMSPGLLPTPNSPIIQDSDMNKYIKPSFFPIPYPAVVNVEYCNVTDVTCWDINVSSKAVKIKIEWAVGSENCSKPKDLFPKPVLSAISTYNLEQPSWSTSYSSKKLLLRIEWKLATSGLNSQLNFSFDPLATPFDSTLNLQRSHDDSGYKSYDSTSHHDVNKSRISNMSPFPPRKLFQNSPKVRHDVYRPKSNKVNDSKLSPDVPDLSSNVDTSGKPDISNVNKPSHASGVNFKSNSHETNIINVPSPVFKPTSSETVPEIVSISSDFDSTVLPQSLIPENSAVDAKVHDISDSTDSISDSDSGHDFDPVNDIFYPIPNPLPLTDNNCLKSSCKAEFMKILGTCRLCGDSLFSHQTSLHLLECHAIDRDPIDTFVEKSCKQLHSLGEILVPIMKDHLMFKYSDSEVPNDTFKTREQFYKFTSGIEDLLERLAIEAFKLANIPKSHIFNILDYSCEQPKF